MDMIKLVCRDCGAHTTENQALMAESPFDKNKLLIGCPGCKEVDTLYRACDAFECWNESTHGGPSERGYRFGCHEHDSKNII